MTLSQSFLTNTQQVMFSESLSGASKGKMIFRSLQEDAEAAARDVKTYDIRNLFSRYRKQEFNFKCYCIGVRSGDGMTWAAEMLRSKIEEQVNSEGVLNDMIVLSAHLRVDQQLPMIVSIIGKKRFFKLALKERITNDFFSLNTFSSILVLLSPFIAHVIRSVFVSNINKAGIGAVTSSYSLLLMLVTLVGALIAQNAFQRRQMSEKSNDIKSFIKALNEMEKKCQDGIVQNDFDNLVYATARSLRGVFPRTIIIDNLNGLDYFTVRVLRCYVEYYGTEEFSTEQRECWFVFENMAYRPFALRGENEEWKEVLTLLPLSDT
ncbi:MAG: hypothetical protein J7621_14210, partial [Niastella sp.]|nr:hypothetical protein [Niastella sp.]